MCSSGNRILADGNLKFKIHSFAQLSHTFIIGNFTLKNMASTIALRGLGRYLHTVYCLFLFHVPPWMTFRSCLKMSLKIGNIHPLNVRCPTAPGSHGKETQMVSHGRTSLAHGLRSSKRIKDSTRPSSPIPKTHDQCSEW